MPRTRHWTAGAATVVLLGGAAALGAASPAAAASPTINPDPYTQATCKASATTNHSTEVEPDTFSYGSTLVTAFQVGRVYDGGGCAIGFATSTDNGATWTSGLLPNITRWTTSAPGPYDRASDASVAYDAAHNAWLVSSLALTQSGTNVISSAVITSRSTDGGLTWSAPVTTATGSSPDKNWIVCDNGTSSYRGNCYTEWDDNGIGNQVELNTSADGGLTWSKSQTTSPASGVIGGQPVVRPDGTVIVPTDNANETAVGAFSSTNGGASWSAVTTVARISHHTVAGSLREGPLPSAEIDGAGTVYVAWADCRFRRSCRTNDIVLAHSTNSTGTTWSSVTRVPIDATNSGVDHFIPGLAVNRSTSGTTAQLGLAYYFYPSGSTQLSAGFVGSSNAGSTWTTASTVASGMPTTWAATTSQGRMVGDYISTSFGSDNLAHAVFATPAAPTTGASTSCSTTALDNCVEPMHTLAAGTAAAAVTAAADPVLFASQGAPAASLWNVVDNNGRKHRD